VSEALGPYDAEQATADEDAKQGRAVVGVEGDAGDGWAEEVSGGVARMAMPL